VAKSKQPKTLRRLNSILAAAVERIMAHDSEADRRKFLRALRYSVDGDGGTPPKVFSPHDIETETGISISEQFDFHVVIDRHRAIEFLRSLRYEPKAHSFRKRLGKNHWKKKELFPVRKVALVGNSYVFTYLEILRIERRTFTPDLEEYEKEYT
jgi:hypothetical protein